MSAFPDERMVLSNARLSEVSDLLGARSASLTFISSKDGPPDDAVALDAAAREPVRQAQVRIVPLTFPKANECVRMWHRHHAPLPGGFAWYCLGAVSDGVVRAAAICGRPTNRNNDDGQTVEVLRISSDGTPNACSALLGAAARVARQMGACRILTYTLESEGGTSLRAAGWNRDKDGITSWWTHAGSRTPAVTRAHHREAKTRWSVTFREPVAFEMPAVPGSLLG